MQMAENAAESAAENENSVGEFSETAAEKPQSAEEMPDIVAERIVLRQVS